MINQRITPLWSTPLWSSPHARFLSALCSATKQASPCCYNPLRAVAGKSLLPLLLLLLLLSIFFFNFIYVIFFNSIFTTTNNKIISDLFSLSNISKLNLNQNTNSNHNFKINQTRKKKKKDKANLTHLSHDGEEDKQWWGRGQVCVNIRRRSLCV